MECPAGIIALWFGSIVSVPTGWVFCNGNNGTPDLRDKFVYGAGGVAAPGVTAGSATHDHEFTSDGHTHDAISSGDIQAGAQYDKTLESNTVTGVTEEKLNLPPFHALAYIMKT